MDGVDGSKGSIHVVVPSSHVYLPKGQWIWAHHLSLLDTAAGEPGAFMVVTGWRSPSSIDLYPRRRPRRTEAEPLGAGKAKPLPDSAAMQCNPMGARRGRRRPVLNWPAAGSCTSPCCPVVPSSSATASLSLPSHYHHPRAAAAKDATHHPVFLWAVAAGQNQKQAGRARPKPPRTVASVGVTSPPLQLAAPYFFSWVDVFSPSG